MLCGGFAKLCLQQKTAFSHIRLIRLEAFKNLGVFRVRATDTDGLSPESTFDRNEHDSLLVLNTLNRCRHYCERCILG